jgi:hypothetical protein
MPPRGNSRGAWRVRVNSGEPALDLHLDIHGPAFPRVPYPDLSAYAGIAFWARSDLPGGEVTVAIEDDTVLATGYPEALDSGRPWFTRRVQVGSDWRRHVLLFDDFRQKLVDGRQSDARVHTKAVWSLHLLNGLDGKPVDYQFDDVALLCRGRCPKQAFDVSFTPDAGGADDGAGWISDTASDPARACAQVASLSTAPPAAWMAGTDERIILRVRVKGEPLEAVPLWRWVLERLHSGEELPVIPLDDESSVVALPFVPSGEYRIRAHTHYPANEVCGVDVTVRL